MMHSLEVRAPYLDIELVDFVRRIPSAYKFRHGETKYILKKALETVLPHEILYRPKKGFGVPIGAWFRASLLTPPPDADYGPLSRACMARKLADHRSDRSDERAFLWNTWLLGEWRSQAETNDNTRLPESRPDDA